MTPLVPIFMVFVITHLVLILGGLGSHIGHAPEVAANLTHEFSQSIHSYGVFGVFIIFMTAYSRGAGTYTGIEAVSNGLQMMREPRVTTGKRTMVYLSVSLAFTAGGILLCYLLFGIRPQEGKTLNGVLVRGIRRELASYSACRSARVSLSSRWRPRARCSSWQRRPVSSTGRGSCPTWRSIRGCPGASHPCPIA